MFLDAHSANLGLVLFSTSRKYQSLHGSSVYPYGQGGTNRLRGQGKITKPLRAHFNLSRLSPLI